MVRKILLPTALAALLTPWLVAHIFAHPAFMQAGQTQAGTIQGVVVREGTSEPIPDVRITATSPGQQIIGLTAQQAQSAVDAAARGSAVPDEILREARNVLAGTPTGGGSARGGGGQVAPLTTTSDSSGRFILRNVPAGNATIVAELRGYFGPMMNLGRGSRPPGVLVTVPVSPNQAVNLPLSLVPGGTISGRVFAPSVKAFASTFVHAFAPVYTNGTLSFRALDQRVTDDRGEYRLFGLPPGEYYIVATAVRGLQAFPRGAPVLPVPDVPDTTLYPSVTDLASAMPVVIRGGDEVSGIDIRMRGVRPARISGRVISTLPPGPVITTQASASLPAGSARPSIAEVILQPVGVLNGIFSAPTVTANALDGSFEFQNVMPGSYELFARMPVAYGWGGQNPPPQAVNALAFGRTPLEVRGTDLEGLAVVVHSGSDVKGRILVDGVQTPAKLQLTLQPDDAASQVESVIGNTYRMVGQFHAPIEPDGSFMIPAVPQGRYRFQVLLNTAPYKLTEANRGQRGARVQQSDLSELPRNAYLADIRQGGVSIYDAGVNVGKETDPVEILIASNAGSIEGAVRIADQKPAVGANVVLVPSERHRQNPALYKIARADEQGRFTFTLVPPGTYKVFSWETVQAGEYQSAEFLRKYETRGTTVTVAAGTRSAADVVVIRK